MQPWIFMDLHPHPAGSREPTTASSSARHRSAAFLRASQLPPFSAFSTRSSNGKISACRRCFDPVSQFLGVVKWGVGLTVFFGLKIAELFEETEELSEGLSEGRCFFSLSFEENKWRPRFLLRTLFWLRSFSRSWGRWWVWQHQIL